MGECRSSRKQAGRDSHHRSSKHTRGHFCVATVHYQRTAQHLCVSNVVRRVACEPAKTQSAQCVESKNLVTTDKAASQLRTYITNIHFVQDLKGERGEWLAAAMVGYDESSLQNENSDLPGCACFNIWRHRFPARDKNWALTRHVRTSNV